MASVRKDLIHRLGETDTHHLPGIFAVTVRGPDAAGGYVMPIGIRPAQGGSHAGFLVRPKAKSAIIESEEVVRSLRRSLGTPCEARRAKSR